MSCLHAFTILAATLQLAVGACPDGAKPFPKVKGEMKYANLFSITYYETYKVIEYSETLSKYNNYHPGESMGGKAIPPLVLYQCGTQKPEYSDKGIKTSEVRFFEIPIENATLGWGAPLPFFELLSVTETISLIDLTYITSPCGQLLEKCTPGIHKSSSPTLNKDWTSAASTSNVVFTDSWGTGWAGPERDIPFQISLDPGTLHRAEWVRFVAAFFNEEEKADQIFSAVVEDYKKLQTMALKLSTDSTTEWKGKKPKVAWITKDSWGGYLKFNNAHYKNEFIKDAGGQMVPLPADPPQGCTLPKNTDGATTLSCNLTDNDAVSSFKKFLKEADLIIDETWVSNHDPKAYNFTAMYPFTAEEIPALARNPPNIFRIDGMVSDNVGAAGAVGSSWSEQMPSQPQQLLAGVMEALWSKKFP